MMDYAGDEAKKAGEALAWTVGVLERRGVPYQVVGGLAARAYGAERPIVDVDLYVPFDRAQGALEEIRPNVVWGPEHHADEEWDLTFLKADFGGQRVELGDSSSDPRFFDREEGRWVSQRVDYDTSARMELIGVPAWVMPEEELVRYKRVLGRPVDLEDVAQIARRRSVGE
jgi:hypothetical protein